VKLTKNTTLVIRSASLISGTKDLDLILGEGPELHQSGDTLLSAVQVEISDYIDPIRQQVQSLVTSVDTLMVALGDLMDEETRNNLQGTIANLNGAASSLKQSLQPEGALSQSMGNLASVTGNLKKSNEEIATVLQNFAAVSDSLKQADLKALINNAESTFAHTSEILEKINAGEAPQASWL